MSFQKDIPLLTSKGKATLIIGGCIFTCNKKVWKPLGHLTQYWQCQKCGNARAKTVDDGEPEVTTDHAAGDTSCQISPEALINKKARQQLLANDAAIAAGTMSEVNAYKEMAESLQKAELTSTEYVANLGYDSFIPKVKLSSAKGRAVRKVYPALPQDLAGIDIPMDSILRRSKRGDRFLLYCEPVHHIEKMLVFTTDKLFDMLCVAPNVYIDGTFKVVPSIYPAQSSQLITISMTIASQANDQKTYTMLYALLPGKSYEVYRAFLLRLVEYAVVRQNLLHPPQQHAQQHGPRPPPVTWVSVLTDFEAPLRNALTSTFNGTRVEGCHFHLCQAIYRHVNDDQVLRALYYAEGDAFEFRVFTKMIMALAFLPPEQVTVGFEELCAALSARQPDVFNNPNVQQFLQDYIVGYWFRDQQSWNISHLDDNRTNNPTEAINMHLHKTLGSHDKNLWQFIRRLKDYQEGVERQLGQFLHAGQRVSRRNSVYIEVNECLKRLKSNLQSNLLSRLKFLFLVSKKVSNPVTGRAAGAAVLVGMTPIHHDTAFFAGTAAPPVDAVVAPAGAGQEEDEESLLDENEGAGFFYNGTLDDHHDTDHEEDTGHDDMYDEDTEEDFPPFYHLRKGIDNLRMTWFHALYPVPPTWIFADSNAEDSTLMNCLFQHLQGIHTREGMLLGAKIEYARGSDGVDYSGLFKALTHTVSKALHDAKKTLPGTASAGVEYFVGPDASRIPNMDNAIQDDRAFFIGFGKYLMLTLLHEGAWPNWLHFSVIKFLMLSDEDLEDGDGEFVSLDDACLQSLGGQFGAVLAINQLDERSTTFLVAMGDAMNFSAREVLSIPDHAARLMAWKLGLVNYYLRTTVFKSLRNMRKGFRLFDPAQLPTLDCATIESYCYRACSSAQELLANISRPPSADTDIGHAMFWELFQATVLRLTGDQAASLLAWCTGTTRVPVFPNIIICFKDFEDRADQFVLTSHTCHNTIDVWTHRYDGFNEDLMMSDLLEAIASWNADSNGFTRA